MLLLFVFTILLQTLHTTVVCSASVLSKPNHFHLALSCSATVVSTIAGGVCFGGRSSGNKRQFLSHKTPKKCLHVYLNLPRFYDLENLKLSTFNYAN